MSFFIVFFGTLILLFFLFVDCTIGIFAILGAIAQVVCFLGGIFLAVVALINIKKEFGILRIFLYPAHIAISAVYLRILYYFISTLKYCGEDIFDDVLYVFNLFYCLAMVFVVTGIYFKITDLYTED